MGVAVLGALASGALAMGREPARPDASPDARAGPFLFTDRLVLRPLRTEDAGGLRGILADPEVLRYSGEARAPTLEEVRGRLARFVEHGRRHGLGLWAVCEKKSGCVVGLCGLLFLEGRGSEVELTYQLKLPPWCKDHAAEAVAACLRYGLSELGLERVIAVMDPDEPISARTLGMLEKAGMRYRETRRLYGRDLFVYETIERALS